MITKHSAIVITCAVIISATILLLTFIHPKPDYTYTIIKTKAGWGYDILQKGQVVIHQEYIPAVQSLQGFPSKEQAEKTAGLVISKMRSGGFPSVTNAEINEILKEH